MNTRYRISPNLVAYWRGGSLRVLNFATKREIRAVPLVVQVLGVLDDWRTVVDIAPTLGLESAAAELETLMKRLAGASILQSANARLDRREVAMAAWGSWNPAAGHFHAMTTGVTYLEDDLSPVTRARYRPPQRPAVSRAGRRVSLTLPPFSEGFPSVLLSRRTWRRFAGGSLGVEDAGSLLWLTAGVQAWLRTPRGERLPLKTSPSGGARHPIEVYVLARHVRTVPSGLYRYDCVRHQLISVGPSAKRVRDYLPRQYWYEDAALVAFFCAHFGKTLARYGYPRAYRAILIEAGHVCQTFCLTATWLGLAPFCTLALDDRRIEADLGLDGITTGVIYAAGVGLRPKTRAPSAPA